MSVYKHGVYGETGSASMTADTAQVTTPIYIGTLPIHRVDENAMSGAKVYKENGAVMMLVSSIKDIKKHNLMSDDWDAYSLCEAIDVHFMHEPVVAPIILICNDDVSYSNETVTEDVTLSKSGTSYVGYLNDSKATIKDMAITVASTTLAQGDVSYAYDGDRIKIVITKSDLSATTASVTYKQVTTSKMSTTSFGNCLDIANKVERVTNRIANILCAPQYSEDPQYHDLMVQKAIEKVDGKWNIVVAVDMGEVDGVESAIAWKKTNSYNNLLEKVFYPYFGFKGKKYHMSTIWTAKAMGLDMENDNIPSESASNKAVFVDTIFDNEGKPLYLSEEEANELNKNGITTAIITKGQIRFWGSHMGNYDFDTLSNIANEDRFDVAVRMSAYIRNYLQYNYLDEIDESINRKDIDSIINRVQMWLDSLVNDAHLLYAIVEFDEDSDLADGNVVFNIRVTYPVIAKSITFKVIYTDKGLSLFTATEEGVE